MEQDSQMHKFWMSLPFWWILLTAIYVTLTFLGGRYVAGPLGLFIPIGIWNLFFSFETASGAHPWIITFPLVLVTIFGGEWLLRKWSSPSVVKFILILGILFILTIAVDFAIWGNWQSLEFLRAGGKIKCC